MFTFGLFSMHLPYIAFFVVTISYMLTGSPFISRQLEISDLDQSIIQADQDSSDQLTDQSYHFQDYFTFDEIEFSQKNLAVPITNPSTWLDFREKQFLNYFIYNRPPPFLL